MPAVTTNTNIPDQLSDLERNAYFEHAARFARDILLLIDQSGRLIECNESAVAAYGYTRNELLQLTIQALRSPETQATIDQDLQNAWNSEGYTFETIHLRKDGSKFPVEVSSCPVRTDGRTLRASIIRDITQRKCLEEQGEQYLKFFMLAVEAMCIADPFGCFKQVNPAMTRLTGYSEIELVSKPFLDFVHPEDRQRTADEMKQQVEVRPTLNFENRYIRKDGSIILLSWTAYFDKADGITYATARDITLQKKLNHELESYFKFFNTSTDLMCIADHNGYYKKVNAAFIKTLGYSESELLSEPFNDFVHPDDLQPTLDSMQAQKERGYTDNFENRYRCKDGSYKWLSWSVGIDQEEGKNYVVYAVAHDITERKLAEIALKESEQLLIESQSIAQLGSYVLDITTGLWKSSAVLDQLFGIDEAYVRTTEGWFALVHPEDREMMSEHLNGEVLGKGHEFDKEYRIVRPHDQVARWVYGLGRLSFDNQGCPIRMQGTIQDITERKQTEAALLAAEEQFRSLVEQSIAGIYIIEDGKFVYVNPRFATIFGFGAAEELIGLDSLSLVAEKDLGIMVENRLRLLAGEMQSGEYNFTALRKDGSSIEVGANGSLASHQGRPAIIGMLQDISEKKRAEELIQDYIAQLKTAFMSTVGLAMTLSELRDPYTAGHEQRVAEIAAAIGAELGLDENQQEGLRVAGFLHDIGKINIPSEILSKPGKLSEIEYRLIQGHAQASYDVLKNVQFPWPVAQIAFQHHERMDGSGYPQGLKGEAILLEARILAVADVVEAMSSHRPYRPGLGIEVALAEIERGRGSAYDPVIADACLRMIHLKHYSLGELL